jgi:hypothetical protein
MPSKYGSKEYQRFRTGLSYRDVYAMLWVHDPDPKRWKYKRRHTILGFWHQLKKQLWEQMLDEKENT